MKTKIQTYRNKQYALVIDDAELPRDDRIKLADMTLFEGTGCWTVMDVRLHPHRLQPSKYFEMPASTVNATCEVKDEKQLEYVKSLLSDYKERHEQGRTYVQWCSWHGIVPGRSAEAVAGTAQTLWFSGYPPMFFSKKDGLAKLEEMKSFWSAFEGTIDEAFRFKLPHPKLQPTETNIEMSLFALQEKLGRPQATADGFDTPSPARSKHKPKHKP